MSLNTSTNGEPLQTVYVYRYYHYHLEYGRGGIPTLLKGYSATLYKPDLPSETSEWNKDAIIEVITVDTTKMTARPIDDYFKRILFVWNDDEYKNNYTSWREWIKQYEV